MCEIAFGLREKIDLEGKEHLVEKATALFRGRKHRIPLRILFDVLLLRRVSALLTVNSFSVISKISRSSVVDASATDSIIRIRREQLPSRTAVTEKSGSNDFNCAHENFPAKNPCDL